jgi:hypothetical protein
MLNKRKGKHLKFLIKFHPRRDPTTQASKQVDDDGDDEEGEKSESCFGRK